MADDSRRLAGTAYIDIDGVKYMVAGDAAYSVNSRVRETLVGMGGVDGYAERPSAGHVSMTIRDAGDVLLSDFQAMTDVTVTLELANGKTIVGRNMWTVEAQESKATDATFEVKWEGPDVTEH